MKSLRARLLAGLLTSSTLILAVHGFGVYVVVRTRLVGELDRSLIDTLRSNAPEIAREALSHGRGQLFPPGSVPLAGRRQLPGPIAPREDLRRRRPERGPSGDRPAGPLSATIPRPAERDDLLFQVRTRDGELLLASVALQDADLPRLAEGLVSATYDELGADLARFAPITLPTTAGAGRAVGLVLQLQLPDELANRRLRSGAPRPPPLEIVMAIDAQDVAGSLARLRWLLVLGWLAASAVGALVILWLLKLGLAPVSALRQQIESFDESRSDTRFELPGAPSELLPVVDQLNSLVDRMAAALTREQEFSGHAAHELRTPLSGLRATLELTLSRPRDPQAHVAAAEQCLEITLQMQQMVEVLLLLARDANPGREAAPDSITLGELLDGAWAGWSERAAERGLTVSLSSAPDQLIHSNASRLSLLLANLLGNAVDHGDPNASIEVSLDHRGERLRLTVSNPASAATEETVSRAFDAFWRGDAARSETSRHSGLGLTLCQRLAASLGGSLVADLSQGRFTMVLTLPAAASAGERGQPVR